MIDSDDKKVCDSERGREEERKYISNLV